MKRFKTSFFEFGDVLLLVFILTLMACVFNWSNAFLVHNADLLLCSAGIWLLLLSLTMPLPRRPRRIVLLGVAILASLILISNQIYYRYYHDVITLTSLSFAGQVLKVRDSILPLARWTDLGYLLPVLIMGWLIFRRSRPSLPRPLSLALSVLVFAGTGLGLFQQGYQSNQGKWGDDINWDGNHYFFREVGLYAFYVFDYQRNASHKAGTSTIAPEAVERIKSYFENRKPIFNALSGVGEGMNLLVVQLESFESFPIGLSIDGQEVTPHLNRMAQESFYFPNIYYQTARGNTSDAEFMLNNSLLPLRFASINWMYPQNTYYSLPLMLSEQGYSSLAFHGYDKIFWNRVFMYPRLGFERYFSQEFFEADEIINLGLSDESFYRQSMGFLEEYPEPFYAKMVTLTSHHPFNMPEEHRILSLPGTLSDYLQGYLHAVHYADKALGALLRILEERGLNDRTVLVIYGDHEGTSLKHYEEIWQLLGHPSPKDWQFASASLQTVPLFIRVPGQPTQGVIERVGGQIDILPTLANILGIKKGLFLGEDLFEAKSRPTPLSGRLPFGSFVDEATLFLAGAPEGEGRMFYDRATQAALAPELAEPKHREVLQMYEYSQSVIKYDLIPQLLGQHAHE
jgi:phosphoglycerol transferase MdoB-like AlkP superfamily enzyme